MDARIIQAGEEGKSRLSFTVEPTDMFAAVNEAGRLLRKYPYKGLAETAFSETVLDTVPPEDVTARSFMHMVNASVAPQWGEAGTVFTSALCGMYGTCGEAEPGFAALFRYVLTRNRPPNPDVHAYEIVTSEDEQPLLMRKGVGEQSALSLIPLTVNGIAYPRGSIMKYDLRRDRKQDHGIPLERFDTTPLDAYRPRPLISESVRVVPAGEIERINFLRLSAFAFPGGKERKKMFADELAISELSKAETRLQWNLNLDDIAEIARREVERFNVHRAA